MRRTDLCGSEQQADPDTPPESADENVSSAGAAATQAGRYSGPATIPGVPISPRSSRQIQPPPQPRTEGKGGGGDADDETSGPGL